MNLLNIGNAQILTIPGEALPNIGFYLKRKMHGRHNLLFGLTNDALGYIITEDEYRHKTYESTISLFGPAFGSLIANESFQLLEKLRPVEKKKP